MKIRYLPIAIALTAASASAYSETTAAELEESLKSMQQQLEAMQAKINQLQNSSTADGSAVEASSNTKASEDGIEIGGAVRFGYKYNADDVNRHNGGDMYFDTFRLDVRGKVKGITLLSKWRWFQQRKALMQMAEMGYDFTENHNFKAGLTLVPFGNQEYNSHNFDLSPNFALGLEDTYQFGGTYTYNNNGLNIQASFFKNDSTTSGMEENSYSPTMNTDTGTDTDTDSDDAKIGSYNTAALRVVNTFDIADGFNIEVGASGLYGGILDRDTRSNVGERSAFAVHSTINYQRWNVQLQATHYEHDLKSGANGINMSYYGYTKANTIATRANSYTANVKYSIPVTWGPIELIEFYNDYTLVTDKPGEARDTYDNTLGMGVAAGAIYAFFDWHTQQNMSDMTAIKENTDHYFLVNIGYYF